MGMGNRGPDFWLIRAIQRKDLAGAEAALRAGASPRACDENMRFALTVAAGAGGGEGEALVRRLLEAGANPEDRGPEGARALHWAAISGGGGAARALLEAGADPNAKSAMELTPLMTAALAGRPEAMAALAEFGGRLEEWRGGKETALHIAAREGQAGAARELARLGARVDLPDRQLGSTPLMLAASRGSLECARALLEAGADPRARSPEGACAEDLARRGGHGECAGWLRSERERRDLAAGVELPGDAAARGPRGGI